jgi:hypothetical protein
LFEVVRLGDEFFTFIVDCKVCCYSVVVFEGEGGRACVCVCVCGGGQGRGMHVAQRGRFHSLAVSS